MTRCRFGHDTRQRCTAPGDFARGLCARHYMAERRAGRLERYPMRKRGRAAKAAQQGPWWQGGRERCPDPLRGDILLKRRHLRDLYCVWSALSADPVLSVRQLARLIGSRSYSYVRSLIADLVGAGFVRPASHRQRTKQVAVPLVRVGEGRVGWWIGD